MSDFSVQKGENHPWQIPPDLAEQWRAEAAATLPTVDEWTSAIVTIRWAAELERRGTLDIPQLPEKSFGSMQCVLALMKLLSSKLDMADYLPIYRIHLAFTDVFVGHVPSIFKPIRMRRGNPGATQLYGTIQGIAARTLDESLKIPQDVEVAARKISSVVRPIEGFGSITAKTIINWRARLQQGRGHGAPEVALYHFLEPIPGNMSPKEMVEFQLKRLIALRHL